MPYEIHISEEMLLVELKGGVTARDAGELGNALASVLKSGARVVVRTRELEDIDTCVLQLLVCLSRTASGFAVEEPSAAFVSAAERCALKRELLAGARGLA